MHYFVSNLSRYSRSGIVTCMCLTLLPRYSCAVLTKASALTGLGSKFRHQLDAKHAVLGMDLSPSYINRRGYPYVKCISSCNCKFYPYVNTLECAIIIIF